jgi:hypothetical protein
VPPICGLCGYESDQEVRMGFVRWTEPGDPPRPFGAMPRCTDRAACRARVERAGEAWEVADTAADVKKAPAGTSVVVVAQTDQPAPAQAEDTRPW